MTFRSDLGGMHPYRAHWGYLGVGALLLLTSLGCHKLEETEAKLAEFEDELDAIANATDVKFTMVHTRYDPKLGEFVELAPPPTKRNPTFLNEIGGRLYVLGGLSESGKYVSAVDRYDDATDSWQSAAPWPRPGFAHSATVGNFMCTFAGYQDLDEPLRREVDCYDSLKDEWFKGPDLPEPYSSAFPAVYNGRIFVVGGSDAELNLFRTSWSYAPGESEWRKEQELPEGRALMGVQAVGDELYVVGGFTSRKFTLFSTDQNQEQTLLAFDSARDTWTGRAPVPHSRALYGLAELRGKLALFFGVTSGPLIEFYDPQTDTWSGGSDPPRLPNGGVYVYAKYDGEIHLLALADGASTSGLSSTGALWKYDMDAKEWAVVARRKPEHRDALFAGHEHRAGIHWIGAHTGVSFDPQALVDEFNADVRVSAGAFVPPEAIDAGSAPSVAPVLDAGVSHDASAGDATPGDPNLSDAAAPNEAGIQ